MVMVMMMIMMMVDGRRLGCAMLLRNRCVFTYSALDGHDQKFIDVRIDF